MKVPWHTWHSLSAVCRKRTTDESFFCVAFTIMLNEWRKNYKACSEYSTWWLFPPATFLLQGDRILINGHILQVKGFYGSMPLFFSFIATGTTKLYSTIHSSHSWNNLELCFWTLRRFLVLLRIYCSCKKQCWDSGTFWCGSGSVQTPDPTTFFSDFKDANKKWKIS